MKLNEILSPSIRKKCNITVSPLLELNATPEQKQRKIDLVDYLFKK
jgi:hypothetical protein